MLKSLCTGPGLSISVGCTVGAAGADAGTRAVGVFRHWMAPVRVAVAVGRTAGLSDCTGVDLDAVAAVGFGPACSVTVASGVPVIVIVTWAAAAA